MASKLRVGVVGLGGNGSAFLDAYATHPAVTVVAVCEVPYGYASLEELLRHEEIDLVSIHAPDSLHASFALAALAADKHVFVEKPMATTLDDCFHVIARADESRRKVAVGQVLRTRPFFRMVKHLVDDGQLGTLFTLRTHYLTSQMQARPELRERAARSYSPGMLTLGVHPVDLMRWYAGDIVEVQAMRNEGLAMPGNPFDEAITALYRFASGAVGTISVCWAANYAHDPYYGLELHGSQASVVRNMLHLKHVFQGLPLPEPPAGGRAGYAAEVDSVVESLLHETPLFCDAREGGRSALACLVALEAAKSGKALAVPNP